MLKPDWRGVAGLTLAHVANDITASALPAILPFLIPARGLSLAAAALLILAMNLSSSVVQPLVGHLADRRSCGWILPVSLILAGLGTASIGLMPSFTLMLVASVVSGVGQAAFHPEASRRVNHLSADQRASGMSWFTLGGYLGFALGPALVTPFLLGFGLPGTLVLAVPALVAAAGMAWAVRTQRTGVTTHTVRIGRDNWRAFGWLSAVVGLRALVFFGVVSFLPHLFVRVLHATAASGNSALTWMLLAGAAGTLLGGRLADRYPRPAVICASMFLTALVSAGLALVSQPGPALALSFGLGLAISLSASVMVVLGQEYLPNHLGVASGVTLGLAISIGGLGVPALGALGDRFGLSSVFAAIAATGALSWLLSLRLRRFPRAVAQKSPREVLAAAPAAGPAGPGRRPLLVGARVSRAKAG